MNVWMFECVHCYGTTHWHRRRPTEAWSILQMYTFGAEKLPSRNRRRSHAGNGKMVFSIEFKHLNTQRIVIYWFESNERITISRRCRYTRTVGGTSVFYVCVHLRDWSTNGFKSAFHNVYSIMSEVSTKSSTSAREQEKRIEIKGKETMVRGRKTFHLLPPRLTVILHHKSYLYVGRYI